MSRDPLAGIDEPDSAVPQRPQEAQTGTALAAPVGLPPTLTISEVGELYALLQAALQGAEPIALDGSSVESVDGAGLQLLAGFVKSADEASLPVSWCGASERLRQAAAIVGLDNVLHLDAAASAS
jgi:anti-anti-sigma regulatory factor